MWLPGRSAGEGVVSHPPTPDVCLHHFTFVLALLAVILLFFCVSVHVFKALFHEARFPNKRGLIFCLKPSRERASGEMLKHVGQVVM